MQQKKQKRTSSMPRHLILAIGIIAIMFIVFLYYGTTGLSAEEYFNRGLTYYDQKDYQKAIIDFTHAIELDPDFLLAYYKRGRAYGLLNVQALLNNNNEIRLNNEKAIEDLTHVIEFDSTDTNAYFFRAGNYVDLNNYDSAIEDYTRVIDLDPDYTYAYINRAYIYYLVEDYDKAIADYNLLIEQGVEYALIYTNLGNVYYDAGNVELALENYCKRIDLVEDSILDRIEELGGCP